MNKKWIVIIFFFVIIIVLYNIIKVATGVTYMLDKFDKINKVTNNDSSYKLISSKFIALNVHSNKSDTINLKNITLINFWATWCVSCIKEQPSFEQLSKMYPKVNFINVSFDSLHKQQKLVEENKWGLQCYFISDTTLFKVPEILPVTYILSDSTVVKKIYGGQVWTNPAFKTMLDTLTRNNR